MTSRKKSHMHRNIPHTGISHCGVVVKLVFLQFVFQYATWKLTPEMQKNRNDYIGRASPQYVFACMTNVNVWPESLQTTEMPNNHINYTGMVSPQYQDWTGPPVPVTVRWIIWLYVTVRSGPVEKKNKKSGPVRPGYGEFCLLRSLRSYFPHLYFF